MNTLFLSRFLWFSIIAGYSIIILGRFGEKLSVFDILSHFYYFYTLLGIIIIGISLFSKNIPAIMTSGGLLIFLVYNLSQADVFIGKYSGKADIFYLNSNYFIQEADTILIEISRHNPDYVMMVEINEELDTKLKQIYKNTVYHQAQALSLGFYTNKPILSSEVHLLSYPILEVETDDFTVFLVHPFPPITPESIKLQRESFGETKYLFESSQVQYKMIVGDLNSSFYSPVFQKYFGDLYYKPIYSWGKLGPFAMPIDYALSDTVFFTAHGTNFYTSDHIPLLLELHEK